MSKSRSLMSAYEYYPGSCDYGDDSIRLHIETITMAQDMLEISISQVITTTPSSLVKSLDLLPWLCITEPCSDRISSSFAHGHLSELVEVKPDGRSSCAWVCNAFDMYAYRGNFMFLDCLLPVLPPRVAVVENIDVAPRLKRQPAGLPHLSPASSSHSLCGLPSSSLQCPRSAHLRRSVRMPSSCFLNRDHQRP